YRPSVTAVSEQTGEVGEFPHFDLFTARDWGLIIYDEVHLLPAPIFRITAEIQARRRLGLTATLVREDGRETDVFSLIGPKKYDVPWKDLEKQGWIATAECTEVRVPLTPEERMEYMLVDDSRIKYRIAAENPLKMDLLEELLQTHSNDCVLVIGQYIEQLKAISRKFGAPLVTGKTPNTERDRLYGEFREGKLKLLVVSKVANFAIDLPALQEKANRRGKASSEDEEDPEAKPRKRGRKKAAESAQSAQGAESPPEQLAEGLIAEDVAAGAEDQRPAERRKGRPPKKSPGRDHLRLVK